jgi:uncharacterized protein YjbI with pentapeptide repeats
MEGTTTLAREDFRTPELPVRIVQRPIADPRDQLRGRSIAAKEEAGVRLLETSFRAANLERAMLEFAEIDRADFRGARLTGARFGQNSVAGALFDHGCKSLSDYPS